MSNEKSARTVREAMVELALEEVDELTVRLEQTAKIINETTEMLPAYFEDASNQVADIIKHGVDTDIQLAHDKLSDIHKQVTDNIEIQRRLNAQLQSIAKQLTAEDNTIKQIAIPAVSAFLGALIAVLIGSFL